MHHSEIVLLEYGLGLLQFFYQWKGFEELLGAQRKHLVGLGISIRSLYMF